MTIYDLGIWLGSTAVALYTLNYARWAWRRRLLRGALGLTLLALAVALAPWWARSQPWGPRVGHVTSPNGSAAVAARDAIPGTLHPGPHGHR